jgi:hypothetical protein
VVEGARLESVYSGNAIAGSNPALSADKIKRPIGGFFIFTNVESLLSKASGNKMKKNSAFGFHFICKPFFWDDRRPIPASQLKKFWKSEAGKLTVCGLLQFKNRH